MSRVRGTRLLAAATVILSAALVLLPGSAQAADSDPLVSISGTALVPEGEAVEGLFSLAADTLIEGTVDGDAIVVSGETTVSGLVEGDLVLVSGPSRLLGGAQVEGDVIYGDEEPEIAPGAMIGGEVRDEGFDDAADTLSDALPLLGGIAVWIAMTVSGLVLGIIMLAFVPRAADAALRVGRNETGMVAIMGISAFIALPAIAAGAAFTLVGLPLALAIGLALLPLAAASYVTTAYVLGRVMIGDDKDRFLCFLAGFAVLRVIAIVPVLGWLAWLAAVIFGLGALILAAHRARSGPEDYAAESAAPAG